MATKKRRRHRRERRLARVKKPAIKRYLCRCHDEQGNPQDHWIWITAKGDIIFRDHKGVNLLAMKAHGCLQSKATGCFHAAARIVGDSETLRYGQRKKDQEQLSDNLAKWLEELDNKRSKRAVVKRLIESTEVLPLKYSLTYRRDLLSARFAYRVHSLVKSIHSKRPWPADYDASTASDADKAFDAKDMTDKHGGGYRAFRDYAWDY